MLEHINIKKNEEKYTPRFYILYFLTLCNFLYTGTVRDETGNNKTRGLGSGNDPYVCGHACNTRKCFLNRFRRRTNTFVRDSVTTLYQYSWCYISHHRRTHTGHCSRFIRLEDSKYHTYTKQTQLLPFPHSHPFHCLISHKLPRSPVRQTEVVCNVSRSKSGTEKVCLGRRYGSSHQTSLKAALGSTNCLLCK